MYLPFIEEQIPSIARSQIIVEPEARDTAPAFAFAAATVAHRNPDAVLGIFYADNWVDTDSKQPFFAALEGGFEAIRQYPGHLAMIGVRPQYAHSGLGYIKLGPKVQVSGSRAEIFRVDSFVEKPPLDVVKRLAASPEFRWNTGYKIVHVQHLLRLLARSHEAYARGVPALVDAVARGSEGDVLSAFTSLPKQSFEYLISEKEKDILIVSADIGWSDIGDWEIVHRVLSEHQQGRLYTAGNVVNHDCENTLLISQHRPIVAVGVKDLVVIETKDAVLVLSKDRSQDVKLIMDRLQKNEPELV
jgi:mannose-1-phosphate guanylyltransferase